MLQIDAGIAEGSEDALFRRIQAFVTGRNEWSMSFPREQLQDLIALILLAARRERSLPPPDAALWIVGALLARAGLRLDDTPEQFERGLADYLRRCPIHPLLIAGFLDIAKEMVSQGAIDKALAFARFAEREGRVLPADERPEGTVPAGPLAMAVVGDLLDPVPDDSRPKTKKWRRMPT